MGTCSGWKGWGGTHDFVTFTHSRRVTSLVHWLHACFSAGLLAPGKEEFSPRRTLQTLLCTDKMTVTLSYRIKNYLSSLVAQCKIFTLSELFPLLGSQLIHLKSCVPTLLSLPTREGFNNHRGQAHLGQLGKPILPTKQHFSNSPLVWEMFALPASGCIFTYFVHGPCRLGELWNPNRS